MVVSLAVLIGYTRLDPNPPEVFVWAWINLFFTCIPEEALFRRFVQQGLQDRLRKGPPRGADRVDYIQLPFYSISRIPLAPYGKFFW